MLVAAAFRVAPAVPLSGLTVSDVTVASQARILKAVAGPSGGLGLILLKPAGGVVTHLRVIPGQLTATLASSAALRAAARRSQSKRSSTARSMACERDATPSFW